jgi:hypothetical protein
LTIRFARNRLDEEPNCPAYFKLVVGPFDGAVGLCARNCLRVHDDDDELADRLGGGGPGVASGIPISTALHNGAMIGAAGLPLAVVNLRQIRNCARATGRLAKTDVPDVQVIALFAERIHPPPRPFADADGQSAIR